jgi:uncharacterized protein YdhG (YjbR/CyaY superfamily)
MKKAAATVTVPPMIGPDKAADVKSYLAACPEPHRTTLEKLRATIRSVVPKETTEAISYGMPSFRYKEASWAMRLSRSIAASSR